MEPDETLTPVQKMIANLRAMRQQGATPDQQAAEIERWKPKIVAFNQREMADAGSAGNLFARGLTANFSDEISGLASGAAALLPGGAKPGEAYRAGRDAIRMTNEAYAAENPGKALAAELTGALAGGVGTGIGAMRAAPGLLGAAGRAVGLVPAATRLGRIGQAVGAGAAGGAMAGAGGAEGDLGDRVRGAGTGAAFGAAAGGVLAGVGAGIGGVARRVGLAPRDPSAGGVAGAIGRTQQGMRRATGVGGLTPDEAAAARVSDQIAKSGRTAEQVLGFREFDPTAMLADVDVGGVQATRLAGSARRLGDEAAEQAERTFGSRMRSRPIKLRGDVARITGQGRVNIEDEAEDLIRQARVAAKPLYDELRKFPATPDPRVNEALELIPEGRFRDIWGTVRNLAKEDGRKLTRDLFDEAGTLKFDLEPSEIDLIKRGLDEVLFDGATPSVGGLSGAERRLLSRARSLLVSAAEDATGGADGVYAQARKAFAGPVAIREALQEGRGLRGMDEETLERAVRDLSPEQRTAFRKGGVESIRADLADIPEGRTGIPRQFTSGKRRAQADEAFGARSGDWRNLLEGEVAREQTEQMVMRGSPTAERLADDEMAELATSLPMGGGGIVKRLAGEGLRRAERSVVRGATAREMDAVMQLLTRNVGSAADRAEVLRLLNAGNTARAELAARAALRRAGIAGVAGGRASQQRNP